MNEHIKNMHDPSKNPLYINEIDHMDVDSEKITQFEVILHDERLPEEKKNDDTLMNEVLKNSSPQDTFSDAKQNSSFTSATESDHSNCST